MLVPSCKSNTSTINQPFPFIMQSTLSYNIQTQAKCLQMCTVFMNFFIFSSWRLHQAPIKQDILEFYISHVQCKGVSGEG